MRRNAPCAGCVQRTVGCHATCGMYKEFKERRDAICEERHNRVAETPEWNRSCLKLLWRRMKYSR